MKLKLFTLALLAVLLITGSVLAVEVTDLNLEYSERYIGDSSFQGSFKCVGPDYTGAGINITKDGWWYAPSGFTETPLGGNTTQIQYNINPDGLDGTGAYTFRARCMGNGSDTASQGFSIYDYELEIIAPTSTIELVQGDYFTTVFTFKKVVGTSKQDVPGAKFNVVLSTDGQEFVVANSKSPDQGSEGLEVTSLISYVPNDDFYGLNDLVVEYSTKTSIKDVADNVVDLKKAFEIYFEDSYPVQMSSGGSLDVPVFVSSPVIESGDLHNLYFDIDIDGSHETLTGSEIPPCSQAGQGLFRCVLPVSIPDKSAGSYQLEIEGHFQSYYDTIIKEIYFTIPFKGELTYASGQVVDATIQMQNLDTGKWYSTTVNGGTGKYSLELLPGEYNMKLTSPEIENIEISGININENSEMVTANSPMSVDSFSGGGSILGINSVKLVVFQFALDFEESEIWIKYKDVDVTGSEEDLELYSCHDWNYGKRQCNGEWETLDFSINMVTNMIHFNVTDFSAFILGNKKSIGLEVEMDKDSYYSRERVTFTGNVIDGEASPIENAKVSYRIEDTELTGSTYTDERGYFIASDLVAPEAEGSYIMEITVEKNPFKSFTTTHPVKIEKKREFTLVVPEEVKVNLDESMQTKISIINTGQRDFNSISLSVRGISTDWYSMVPMTINNLTIGSEKTVTLNFRVPSEYCKEECQIYHFVDITARSDGGLEEVKSFTFQIDENVTEIVSPGFSLPSLPTGNVIESISNPYVAVIIFIVIAFLFIFFSKNKGIKLPSLGRRYDYGKKSFSGGTLKAPTFFKKGYSTPINSAPFKSYSKKAPRESVVPTLYQVKKSTREWD